ncbi:hypothetical protein HK100_003026 [Physocladia obscura]|uniref:Transmembrane protein n=1 Tax=Physocladia obscura TaxID=109957 RepID=A0AAD5SVG1_9FUNG|nr:hypothetical protein HK100_003026 [Physocladia obscura]
MATSITGFSISNTGNGVEYAITVTSAYELLHPQETISMTITAVSATTTTATTALCSAGPASLMNLQSATCIGSGASCRILSCLAAVPTDLVGLPVTVSATVALNGQALVYRESVLFSASSTASAKKTTASLTSSTNALKSSTKTTSSSFSSTASAITKTTTMTQTITTGTTIPLAATSSTQNTSAAPSTAALVGGIVGGAFALFALVFAWLAVRRRMRRVRREEEKTIAWIESGQVGTSVSVGARGGGGGGGGPALYDSTSGTVTPQRSVLSGGGGGDGGFPNGGAAFVGSQQQQWQQGYYGQGYLQPGVVPISTGVGGVAPAVPMPVHVAMGQSQQLQQQQVYPGYYDGFGQYHYYTAEELAAMQQSYGRQ